VAAEPGGRVENVRRRFNAGQPRGGEGLFRGLALVESPGIALQVDLVEELVPVVLFHQEIFFNTPSARWFQGTRCVTPAARATSSRWARYQS
jgi:hypothetical protein